jgi:hypothetical protein
MGQLKKWYTARQMGERIPAWLPRSSPARLPDAPRASCPAESPAAVVRATDAPGAARGTDGAELRPLCFLMPGAMPVRATAKMRRPKEAVYFAYEGDPSWRKLDGDTDGDRAGSGVLNLTKGAD